MDKNSWGSGGGDTGLTPEHTNIVTNFLAPSFTGDSLEFFAPNSVSTSPRLSVDTAGSARELTKCQVIYASGFSKDPMRNKLFVYTIFTLEVVQTIILTKSYFDVFGYGFDNPEAYDRSGAIWFSVPFMSGIVAFLAEVFYAMRLYKLSQSYTVPIVVCTLAVVQASGAIANAIVVKDAGMFSRIPDKAFHISSSIWAGGSALCDVVIAYFMTRYLWRRRNEGVNTTQIIVNRIIRLVLETGTVTAVFAVTLLVLTMLPNHVSYYQVPAAILAKLYSNSMLALLNSRINPNPSTDIECKPPVQQLTVMRFVETFQDTGVAAAKPHDSYANSVDEGSVGSG